MEVLRLVASIIVCELAGAAGAIFTVRKIPTWYANLKKPSFRPPNWLFAPVWTALYLLMGIAAFLVWQEGLDDRGVQVALAVFLGQLALNVLWSAVFFGLESPLGGLAVIVLLWGAILTTIIQFAKFSTGAAFLLVPYILWVSFAAVLNGAIYILNRKK